MATKPETRFKEKVYKRLRQIPGIYFTKIQQVAIRGVLDLHIGYKGKFLAWELKVGNNKMDPLQAHEASKIRGAGCIARVVTPETLDEAMEELLNV